MLTTTTEFPAGKQAAITAELKRLAAEHNGLLEAEVVVEAARPETSLLHNDFEWDDTVAGQKFRLAQARQLIRVVVQCEPHEEREHRVFVSLSSDRSAGGGYRVLVDVMSNAQHQNQLLADAHADMVRFQQRYRELRELSDVFAAMKKVA